MTYAGRQNVYCWHPPPSLFSLLFFGFFACVCPNLSIIQSFLLLHLKLIIFGLSRSNFLITKKNIVVGFLIVHNLISVYSFEKYKLTVVWENICSKYNRIKLFNNNKTCKAHVHYETMLRGFLF